MAAPWRGTMSLRTNCQVFIFCVSDIFFLFYFNTNSQTYPISDLEISYVQSQKGHVQLRTSDGFYYVKEKVVNYKVYWRCAFYTTKIRCHSRIHTINEKIVRQTQHNHPPSTCKERDKNATI